jgi:hypothetical protein
MCKEYNGWSNWETWVAKLWLDNDEYVHAMIVEMVQDAKDSDGDGITGQELEEFVWNTFDPDGAYWNLHNPSLFTEFIMSGMNTANWDEIASAYNQDGY